MNNKSIVLASAFVAVVALGSVTYFGAQAPGSDSTVQTEQSATGQNKALTTITPVQTPPTTVFQEQTPGQTTESLSLEDRLRAGDTDLLEKYGFGERELALANIDLEALKAQFPDSLYWQMAAPTQDEALKQQRKETRDYWREQKNQISANLADEYTIRDYYAQQHALSEDYVAVTDVMLDQHAMELPERDYSLLLMANKLHSARLQEIPAELARALEKRTDYLARKEAWHTDRAAYEEGLRKEREEALQLLSAARSENSPNSN